MVLVHGVMQGLRVGMLAVRLCGTGCKILSTSIDGSSASMMMRDVQTNHSRDEDAPGLISLPV